MVNINFIGDISLFKEFERRNIDPFEFVWLPNSDYSIANFEFSIPNNRTKNFFDVSNEYAVSFDYFNKLKIARFNAYGLSNNHCLDYSDEGARDMINTFELNNVKSFGFGKRNFNILNFNIKGVSIAIISFVKNGRWNRKETQTEGPDSYNLDEIICEIKCLKKKYNHVIVFPHWGTELVDVPNPEDVKNARKFIDCGAAAVIGHHPHIIQGIERYKKGIIAYSLGSFIYVPEKEKGYNSKQDKKRDYSICLNISFNENKLVSFKDHYYKYNSKKLIPEPVKKEVLENYLALINDKIGDPSFYNKRIREVLVKRELIAFIQRLKASPFKTIVHYFKYLRLSHFKKIITK